MVDVRDGMDDHSMETTRDGEHIGYVQWHPEREPRIVFSTPFSYLTINEIEDVLQTYRRVREKRKS